MMRGCVTRWRIWLTALLLPALCPVPAYALATDPMIEGAKQCTHFLPRFEREYGIPVHLLSAIASTESGRWHEGLRIALPWPWTINADGRSYYYGSRQEAVSAARRLRAQGVKNMDVGCMQVSLTHHPRAFRSLEDAFEPETNVAYAASFLRDLYEQQRSWRSAAAAYHSKTPVVGGHYVSRVYDRWYTIIDRVRSARLSVARKQGGGAVAPNDMLTAEEQASAKEAASPARPVKLVKTAATVRGGEGKGSSSGRGLRARAPAYKPVRMKVIEVRDEPGSREKEKLVVHAEKPQQQVAVLHPAVAVASVAVPAAAAVPAVETAPGPKVLKLSAPAAPAGGPRFIFND